MKNNNIDWEQVRIDASINIMNAILSSSIMVFIFQFILISPRKTPQSLVGGRNWHFIIFVIFYLKNQ